MSGLAEGDSERGERWYGAVRNSDRKMGRAQVDIELQQKNSVQLAEGVLRLAQAEYEAQYGHQQDYERMQERHGLSVLEIVGLLADYVERLGGKPTTPRVPS